MRDTNGRCDLISHSKKAGNKAIIGGREEKANEETKAVVVAWGR